MGNAGLDVWMTYAPMWGAPSKDWWILGLLTALNHTVGCRVLGSTGDRLGLHTHLPTDMSVDILGPLVGAG